MSDNYIKNGFLKKLMDPSERNKVYSMKDYAALRNRVIRKLVCEFGSNPAWITLFGSILSSVFFVNWLLAINYLDSLGGLSGIETDILEALRDVGIPSMIAFFLMLFLALFVTCFFVSTSVDQYKLRKGLSDCPSTRPHGKDSAASIVSRNSEDKTNFAFRSNVKYMGFNLVILILFAIALIGLIVKLCNSGDFSEFPVILEAFCLLTIAAFHVKTLTWKNRKLAKGRVSFWFIMFLLALGAIAAFGHFALNWKETLVFIFIACSFFTLIWFATNGIAYGLAYINAKELRPTKRKEESKSAGICCFTKMAKRETRASNRRARQRSSSEPAARALSRWIFRDMTALSAIALFEFPLIFILEVAGCRLLVLLFRFLYDIAPFFQSTT